MANGDTKTNQYLDIAANGTRADLPSDTCCETRTQSLIRGVAERVMDVEDEVERLENNPDVVDIVATYADLQAYDTSTLTDKDVIRVLQDETHDGESTYYRYNEQSDSFTYIGTSKTYSNFVGTDGTAAGAAGLVPAPATTDAGKVLGASGNWVDGGPTVVQTTGTSTTSVMSQDATTSMVFADQSTKKRIQIGNNTKAGDKANYNSVAIGDGAKAYTGNDVVIGNSAQTSKSGASASGGGNVAIGKSAAVGTNNTLPTGCIAIGDTAVAGTNHATAIGDHTEALGVGSVALGSYATTASSQRGVMNIGTTTTNYGYSQSNYRLLTGVYDPQNAHDAATKGYVDSEVLSNAPLILYVNDSDIVSGRTMSFYADNTFTTAVTVGTIHAAVSSGRDVKILRRIANGSDYAESYTYSVYRAYYPKECNSDSMDETGMTLDTIDAYGQNTKKSIRYQTFSGPSYDDFNVIIETF